METILTPEVGKKYLHKKNPVIIYCLDIRGLIQVYYEGYDPDTHFAVKIRDLRPIKHTAIERKHHSWKNIQESPAVQSLYRWIIQHTQPPCYGVSAFSFHSGTRSDLEWGLTYFNESESTLLSLGLLKDNTGHADKAFAAKATITFIDDGSLGVELKHQIEIDGVTLNTNHHNRPIGFTTIDTQAFWFGYVKFLYQNGILRVRETE